ncbi:MAG: DUF1761 domain-containing protein [Bacteroidia bacterium]
MEPHLNFMALICAALVPLFMGFIYYRPSVMGNAWMKANGFTKESMDTGHKPAVYLLALVASFMLAFFMWGWVTGAGGIDTFQVTDPVDGHSYVTFSHGVFHGIAFSVLVLLPVFVTMKIFEKRSWPWAFVNWGYWSITVILMNGILSAWR